MKLRIVLSLVILVMYSSVFGQILKNGTYIFSMRDAEYVGHPIIAKCKVIIKGDKIKVIYLSNTLTNIKKGEIFDEGILMRHRKTKQWIIGQSKKDIDAQEVGGCSEGPRVIDLKKKVIWNC